MVMLFGIAVAACGGGSTDSASNNNGVPIVPGVPSGTSAASTPVGSLLASNGGDGGWGRTATSASAWIEKYTPTAAANTYISTWVDLELIGGSWSPVTFPADPTTYYELGTNGWVDVTNAVWYVVDSGDGTHIAFSNTVRTTVYTMAQTSLTGAIACSDPTTGLTAACAVPGIYPAGAAEFTGMNEAARVRYSLFSSTGTKVTNAQGVALTALPAVGDTFCDPMYSSVYQPITPAPVAGNNYNVISAASCSQTDITTALAGAATTTALISTKATGNAVVPNVLLVTYGSATSGQIFGLQAGAVSRGYYANLPADTTPYPWGKNKIAVDAELTANGLPVLP